MPPPKNVGARGGHDDVHAGKDGVQDAHPQAVGHLGRQAVLLWNSAVQCVDVTGVCFKSFKIVIGNKEGKLF